MILGCSHHLFTPSDVFKATPTFVRVVNKLTRTDEHGAQAAGAVFSADRAQGRSRPVLHAQTGLFSAPKAVLSP